MNRTGDAAAAIGGRALALLMRGILVLRRPRPIHSTGLLLEGRLRWLPRTTARAGIGWIDDRAGGLTSTVTARFSRGAGLPAALPDVLGLALRVPSAEGWTDLLLSTTGLGVPGRFLLLPRWTPARAVFSSLMPFRGAAGPVLVAGRVRTPARLPAPTEALHDALLESPMVVELLFARPLRRWHRFAEVVLEPWAGGLDGDGVRFDPVLHAPAGATTYGWARLLREPSYARARRGRP